MASRGKVLVQMCLDSSETIASNIYNEGKNFIVVIDFYYRFNLF